MPTDGCVTAHHPSRRSWAKKNSVIPVSGPGTRLRSCRAPAASAWSGQDSSPTSSLPARSTAAAPQAFGGKVEPRARPTACATWRFHTNGTGCVPRLRRRWRKITALASRRRVIHFSARHGKEALKRRRWIVALSPSSSSTAHPPDPIQDHRGRDRCCRPGCKADRWEEARPSRRTRRRRRLPPRPRRAEADARVLPEQVEPRRLVH